MTYTAQKHLDGESKIQSKATLAKLQSLVAPDLLKVNQVILEAVESDATLIPQIAQHLIASGGKRLRPTLTLICARLCGYDGDQHVRLAAAVEFIHSATLLHDDVVDESTMRRGLETANNLWGNQASVLVGDFLLSRAFQLMVSTGQIKVLRILSDTSAIISQGEVKQLMNANNPAISMENHLEVITAKTAALFAAACELGAVIAGQEALESKLYDFGLNLGIAFQLVDDILDYAATQGDLGKTIGDDFREGKVTLPVLLSYAHSNAEEKAFWERTLQAMQQQEGDLSHAIALLEKHGAIREAMDTAAHYCELARKSLDSFAETPEKAALIETVDFCLQRAY